MPVHVGDVFLIPVDEDRQAVGQIVARYRLTELYCLVVFDDIVRSGEAPPSMEPRSDRAIIFVASTFDAMLEDGWWRTLGNSAPCAVQLPAYKILQEGVYYIESWDGSKRRRAKPEEVAVLDNRGGVAPIRVENAVKAHYGVLPWQPVFEKLKYEYAIARAVVRW